MEEIIIDICDVHDRHDWLVEIEGVYGYLKRRPELYTNTPLAFETSSNELLNILHSKAIAEQLMCVKEDLYNHQERRYVKFSPSVKVDSLNTIELLGLMQYAKAYTLSYALLDNLDFILACVFKGDTESVRHNLEERCKMFNTDYYTLSRALLLGDLSLLKGVNVKVFINITEELNAFINRIYLDPANFIYSIGNSVVSLADKRYTPELRIVTFIMHKVLFFAQLALNTIILKFKNCVYPFESNSCCMLLSKGSYNIVFTAKHNDFPDILLRYGNNSLTTKPLSFYSLGE